MFLLEEGSRGKLLKFAVSSSQSQHKMEHGAATDFIFRGRFIVIHLFSRENKPLLGWRNAFLLFHALFDSFNLICGLDVDFNLLPGESFYFDQHGEFCVVEREGTVFFLYFLESTHTNSFKQIE